MSSIHALWIANGQLFIEESLWMEPQKKPHCVRKPKATTNQGQATMNNFQATMKSPKVIQVVDFNTKHYQATDHFLQ